MWKPLLLVELFTQIKEVWKEPLKISKKLWNMTNFTKMGENICAKHCLNLEGKLFNRVQSLSKDASISDFTSKREEGYKNGNSWTIYEKLWIISYVNWGVSVQKSPLKWESS